MDTLVFRLQFLLTSLYRTLTDKPAHMPRIQHKGAIKLHTELDLSGNIPCFVALSNGYPYSEDADRIKMLMVVNAMLV